MADINTIKFLSLTGLQNYDVRIKAHIDKVLAAATEKSFKYVNLVDGVLKFYTVNPISEDTVADFEIELPVQDLDHLMALVQDAVSGNIATFGDGGQVVDSGVSLNDLATKSEVQNVTDGINMLDAYIGDIPEDAESTNVIAYINEKAREVLESATGGSSESAASVKLALDEYKAENDPKVTANTEAIAKLNGDETVEGSVERKIADAINAFAANITDNNTIDTFKEVLEYIANHGGDATDMMAAIDTLEALVGDKAVATQIAEAIGELNLGQYTTDEEFDGLISRVVALEDAAHVHENETVLNDINAEKVTAWNSAESNANTYTDSEVNKVKAVIGEIEDGKTVVEMISGITFDDSELKAADEAMANEIEALKAIVHEEISVEDIDSLFPEL